MGSMCVVGQTWNFFNKATLQPGWSKITSPEHTHTLDKYLNNCVHLTVYPEFL